MEERERERERRGGIGIPVDRRGGDVLTGGEVGGTVVSQYPERGLPLEVARRLWRDVARVLRRLELAALLLLLTPTVAAAGQGHDRVGRLLGL